MKTISIQLDSIGVDSPTTFPIVADVGITNPTTITKEQLVVGLLIEVDDLATEVALLSNGGKCDGKVFTYKFPPTIDYLQLIQHHTVTVGQTPNNLSVSACCENLTYQWYLGSLGDTSQPIVGATSSTYNPGPLSLGQYCYWLRVTNPYGHSDTYQMCIDSINPTPTPTPSVTPPVTPTVTPTVTRTHVATATPTPSVTGTLAPTPTPSVTPTHAITYGNLSVSDAKHIWGLVDGTLNVAKSELPNYNDSSISYISNIHDSVANYVIYASPKNHIRLYEVERSLNGWTAVGADTNLLKRGDSYNAGYYTTSSNWSFQATPPSYNPQVKIPAGTGWYITINGKAVNPPETFNFRIYDSSGSSVLSSFQLDTGTGGSTYYTFQLLPYPQDIIVEMDKTSGTGADITIWSGNNLPVGIGTYN